MESATPAAFKLEDHQGRHRVLLVFAPSRKSPAYEQQMLQFGGEEAGFGDRDLLLVEVFDEGVSRAGGQSVERGVAENLRARFGVGPDDFAVVLVGKDGTERRRDDAPVLVEALYQEIDAMPMRQREIEAKRNHP